MLSAPFWLYQLWAFITPGLKRKEKRYGIGFVAVSTLLFAAGAVLAYISLAKGLQLLLSLAGDGVVVALTAQDYIGFVLSLLVAFGVSFEVPLIAIALNLVGVLQLRGAARRAGAGSSSSPSSSPRSSRPPRTRSPCCSWPGR